MAAALKPIRIGPFKGLNNRLDPTALGLEWQLQAENALWRDIFITLLISGFSGAASYLYRVKKQNRHTFSLIELAAEIMIAWLAGFVALMVCLKWSVDVRYIGGIVALTGHGAARLLFLAELFMIDRAKRHLGIEETEDDSSSL